MSQARDAVHTSLWDAFSSGICGDGTCENLRTDGEDQDAPDRTTGRERLQRPHQRDASSGVALRVSACPTSQINVALKLWVNLVERVKKKTR